MARPRRNRSPMVVVDLSRSRVKLALAEKAGEAVRFEQMAAISPPQEGEPGYPADEQQLAALMRQEVERRGWRGRPAACLLSRASTSTQSFVLPAMPDSELRQAIELKLSETLHFGIEEATYAYRSLGDDRDDGMRMVLVAAAQRSTVLSALRMLREAGLRPVAVSTAAESLANLAYHARLANEGEAAIHVDIGDDATVLNLFEDRLLRFSREIDISSRSFTRALMRPVLTQGGSVTLDRGQADEVLAAAGCPRLDEDLEWPHGVRSHEILSLLEPVVQRLSAEIERSVEYMQTLITAETIDRIVLSGPSARMRNLGPTLSESLDMPVAVIEPVGRACAHWRLAIRDAGQTDASAFSAILGYAMGQQQPLNLLPDDERLRLVVDNVARTRRVVAPFAVAGAAAIALAAIPILGHYERAEESARFALSELGERRSAAESLALRQADTQARAGWLARAQGPTAHWEGLFKELGRVLPETVQLTALTADQDNAGVSVQFDAVVHSGTVPFEVTVTEMTVALGASPLFTSTHIVNATASDADRGHVEVVVTLHDDREPVSEDGA